MTKHTKKQRKPNKAGQKLKKMPPIDLVQKGPKYIPRMGDEVLIVHSSANYADGKVGTVESKMEDGWAVTIKTKKTSADNYGALENQESKSTVFCSELKPYTPKDEKR